MGGARGHRRPGPSPRVKRGLGSEQGVARQFAQEGRRPGALGDSRLSGRHGQHPPENKGCSSGREVCTGTPCGGRCLRADGAAEGGGCGADLGLQAVPGPYSRGRGRRQPWLQKVCPGGGAPAAGAELQEAVRRLRDIREAERELDTWFQAQSAPEPQHPVNQSTTPAVTHEVSKQAEDATEWKAARARRSRRKKKLPQNPELLCCSAD